MRHRESSAPPEVKIEIKNECSIDIKDEDLDVFSLEIPLDENFVASDEEKKPIEHYDEDTLLDAESYKDSSFFIRQRRRKALQPQRASSTEDELSRTLFAENTLDISSQSTNPGSEDELQEIELELEMEMASNDEDDMDEDVIEGETEPSRDSESHSSRISNENGYTAEDEELEEDDGIDEPPDMETDDVFKGLKEEAVGEGEELDEKTHKRAEEEWKAHWGVKCNMCNKVFPQKAAFDDHYRKNHKTKPVYTCSYCDKSMVKYSTFRSHCYRHIAEGRFKCSYCTKAFSLRSMLHLHKIARHTDIKPYVCEECGKGFVTRAGLNMHLRKHKPNQKEDYPCGECGKTLQTRGGLTAHMNVHRQGRRFMCDICGKTFTQKVNMQQHVKQHTGERPFTCDQCGKSFAEKSHLARHHSFHTNFRPYRCNVCNRMYKTERCLKVHSLVHAATRPHVCSYCSKGFLSSTKLKQHHNIHTGERPFKCKYCEKTFTNYPNWLKHTRRRHNVDHKTGLGLAVKQENETLTSSTPTTASTVVSSSATLTQMSLPIPMATTSTTLLQPAAIATSNLVDDVNEVPLVDPLLLEYPLTDQSLLTTTVQQLVGDEAKLNMASQLFPPSTFDIISTTGYTNMGLMLPSYQTPTTSVNNHHHVADLLEQAQPQPHHQILIQPAALQDQNEAFPAHQTPLLYQEHIHFIHTQQMLQM